MPITPKSLSKRELTALLIFIESCGESGAEVLRYGSSLKDPQARLAYWQQAGEHLHRMVKDPDAENFARIPVDPRTFVESPTFLNQPSVLYPKVMECFIEMNNGQYVEAVLTGGIGTGKTTLALFSTAYQLYLLSCYENPHKLFGLDPNSEIVFVFQSIRKELAQTVDYARFKSMIDQSPYFDRVFTYRKDIESELRFKNRILVKPLSGSVDAAIGQNVMGGVMDEVNFMQFTENSKMMPGGGGTFDQAVELYNSIVRRRKSRFSRRGKLPGLLCLVSSKRYPGEFTERKADEAAAELKKTGRTQIYVYDKRVWEMKPAGSFSGKWFRIFTGDLSRKPRILEGEENPAPQDMHLVMAIPEEYRDDFDRDVLSALRDIAGVSTHSVNPFMMNTDVVALAFGKAPAILSRTDCDFTETTVQIYPKRFWQPDLPRFVHMDFALAGDSLGMACGTVSRFVPVDRGTGEKEMLPVIRFDFTLEVRPPKHDEIQLHRARGLLYKLKELGLNVKWATMDTFQSADSIQVMRQRGFLTGVQSLDTDDRGYQVAKQAFYDKRVELPTHQKVLTELIRLTRNEKTGKVDHPPAGSKDVSDCVAGVIFGLTYRREMWHVHGVPTTVIPKSLLAMENVDKRSIAKLEDKKAADAARANMGYMDIVKEAAFA